MVWHKDFYVGAGIGGNAKAVKWKILHNVRQWDVYVIALGSVPGNLLDIIPAWELRQRYYPKEDLVVVGVDKGYDNALDLAGEIVLDVYRKTGDFKVRDHFLGKRLEGPGKEVVWES